MPASRKPTVVHQISGAFKKNPDRGRSRSNEPVPKAGIGPAPAHLSEQEQACWDEIVNIAPNGVLYDSDRLALEITAKLLAKFRRDEHMPPELTALRASLSALGMTPADRSKVSVPDKAAKNPFGQL
jgi:hypothetical protein